MSQQRRFLFLYSRTGGGHLAAARAVTDAMQARFGDAVAVDLVDIFVESGVWPFAHFPDWYPTMLGLGAWPWRAAYHLTDHPRTVQIASRLLWPYVRKPLQRLMAAHPCDAIVSFHPIPNAILNAYRTRNAPSTPLAVVVQDLVTAPAGWFAPGLDAYFLPQPATEARALKLGLPEQRLHLTGLPVRPAFSQALAVDKAAVRAELGAPPDQPLVLFVGGGNGAGDMFPFVQALMARKPAAQVVVITGRNESLQQRLSARCNAANLRVLGYEQQMPLWMRAADILVSKAGPNSLAEAFVMGLPVVVFHAIPGQESGNPELVASNGAGVWAPHPGQAADAVMHLLGDEKARDAMGRAARALARPHASDAIARLLWEMVDENGGPGSL